MEQEIIEEKNDNSTIIVPNGIKASVELDGDAIAGLSIQVLKGMIKVYIVLMFIFALLGAIFIWLHNDFETGIIIVVVGIIVPPVLYIINMRGVKKKAYKSVQVSQQMQLDYTFGDKIYITEKSLISSAKDMTYEWSGVIKAREDASYLYLYINPQTAFIIKKEAIKDGTVDELKEMVTKYVGANAKFMKNAKK